ncbi:Protein abrupt [Chionoecetes opilio]|uniref:Protein abrupt n=1 Tax=Chionoecetes opilio TaxID=41210 RepID=A0A8J4Y945_CHIOP|nr:Protein abrupt [Chionoecetes opilio]
MPNAMPDGCLPRIHSVKWFTRVACYQVYTDVTLSCGDQFYPAHRLVLSACSTFLARSLEVASCKAPMILLHGVDQTTLEQLLMFMYDGQVTISKMDLPKLLKAAHWLGVKGLDSALGKHSTEEAASENESPSDKGDFSNFMEIWKQLFSSFTGTTIQKENIENILYKQIASKIAGENGHSSKTVVDLAEAENNQEKESQDSVPSLNIKIRSLTDPDPEEIRSISSITEQEKGDDSNSNSFHGWVKSESYEEYNLPEIIEKPVGAAGAEADSTACSDTLDESTETSKENNAAEMNKRSLRCKHCRKSFKIRKDLARHLRIHHGRTVHHCASCHKQFGNKKEFTLHMKLHKAQTVHSCDMCEFASHSVYGLKKHIRTVHGISANANVILSKAELFQDSVQNIKIPRGVEKTLQNADKPECSNIKISDNIECPVLKMECSNCLKKFKEEIIFKRHLEKSCQKIIRAEKGFQCPICLYVSDRLRSVEDHIGRHTGNYRFRCSHCPYQCVRNHVLQEHMSKRHPEFK